MAKVSKGRHRGKLLTGLQKKPIKSLALESVRLPLINGLTVAHLCPAWSDPAGLFCIWSASMPRPSPLSGKRIERGDVVSGPCDLLAIVIGVQGTTATLCRILQNPRYRHRSDVQIGLGDAVTLGIGVGNKVRCRVFRLNVRHLARRNATISADLLARVRAAVEKEDATTRWERAETRSGGVSRIYG